MLKRSWIFAGAIALVATAVLAAEVGDTASPTAPTASKAGPALGKAEIAKLLPGAKAEDVRPSPIEGMYEVAIGANVVYVSADGRYAFNGDLFEIKTRNNLSEERRATARRAALATLKDKDTIVFAPAEFKHTVTVFTDVDCGYCRKLHSEIAQINKLGIRVRYAAYPRSGPGTPSWEEMKAVWCAKDRNEAMTRAKQGEKVVGQPGCDADKLVSNEYQLGDDLGVRGTPAIMTEAGEIIGGYMPAAELAKALERTASR
jgi:thiol:disulfide interchange protein DsbC